MGTLISLRDAESRRQVERQLDLSSRLAALSRLTSGVAHEIKNPLNAMALQLEILRGKLASHEPEVDVIAGEIKRLDNVVKTFLNFNKPMELEAKPINLTQLVEEVVALVTPEARAKHVSIEAVLEGGLQINGDADMLKQAILNVINNGLEAMPDGGKLVVRTKWDGDDCQLEISDAGRRHSVQGPGSDLQFVFHYQEGRLRNRPGDHIPRGAIARRHHRLCERTWERHDVPAAFSGNARLPG